MASEASIFSPAVHQFYSANIGKVIHGADAGTSPWTMTPTIYVALVALSLLITDLAYELLPFSIGRFGFESSGLFRDSIRRWAPGIHLRVIVA